VEDFADFSVFSSVDRDHDHQDSPQQSDKQLTKQNQNSNDSGLSEHFETLENIDFGDPTFDDDF